MAICRPCTGLPCGNPGDLAAPIDSAIYSSLDYSFLVECPTGCYCPPGLFPRVISILQSVIPPVLVPINEGPGTSLILRLVACDGTILTRTLSSDSTTAQINSAAQSLQSEWAGKQSVCIAQATPAVNCNTGTSINVCNDAQTFPCYDGNTYTVPAGIRCQTLNITGLTQSEIDSATAVIKARLNDQAKETLCPFFKIICEIVHSQDIVIGFSTVDMFVTNVSGVTKDLTGFQLCFGNPPTFCTPPNGVPPTSVGPHSTVHFGGGSGPLPTAYKLFYLGLLIDQSSGTIPINDGVRIDVTVGCAG